VDLLSNGGNAGVSIASGGISVSGAHGGRLQIISTDADRGSVTIGNILGTASDSGGQGASVGIFALGAAGLSDVNLANIAATAGSTAGAGDLFVSSDSAIAAGSLSVLGGNGAASGWIILVNSKNQILVNSLSVGLGGFGLFPQVTAEHYLDVSSDMTVKITPQ